MALGIRSRLNFDVSECVQTLFSPQTNEKSSFSTINEESQNSFDMSDVSFEATNEWNSELLTPTSSDSSPSFLNSPSPKRMQQQRQSFRKTPPNSPPSLRALRLFDTPHTPKTLLERSKNYDTIPESADLRNPRGRKLGLKSRRLVGVKKPFSEPRDAAGQGQIEANINPFTPNHNESSIQKHKRSRINPNR